MVFVRRLVSGDKARWTLGTVGVYLKGIWVVEARMTSTWLVELSCFGNNGEKGSLSTLSLPHCIFL